MRDDCAERWSAKSALRRARWGCALAGAAPAKIASATVIAPSGPAVGFGKLECGCAIERPRPEELGVLDARTLDRIDQNPLRSAERPDGLQATFADAVVNGPTRHAEQARRMVEGNAPADTRFEASISRRGLGCCRVGHVHRVSFPAVHKGTRGTRSWTTPEVSHKCFVDRRLLG